MSWHKIATMSDTLTLRVLRFLPRNLISRVFGWIARRRRPRFVVRPFMSWFARHFQLNMDEAERTFDDYDCLLDLFTRRLKTGARTIDQDAATLVSPVDGAMGAFGRIEEGRLVQAKGLDYSLESLLADTGEAARFSGGSFMTIYLSPQDYHRIHAPRSGEVRRTLYEPGTLWPVNEAAVRNIPSLFAVNERVTTFLATDQGDVAVCMVGATNVGSIALSYHDLVSNRKGKRLDLQHREAPHLERGAELGIFQLGSTVILLVADAGFRWRSFEPGEKVRLGTALGSFQPL